MESSNSSETQDIEMVKKMEDEHLRLQRQFRSIQTDREHRTMGVHPRFRSQDHLLRTLKKEYLNLVKDLKIARSGRHKKNDKKMKNDLRRTLISRIDFETQCEGRKAIMEELQGLLQTSNKEMTRLRKLNTASEGEMEARRFQSEHRLMSSENELEAAMLRFNKIQCENRKIREEIEHMLKDRALFKQSWDKMLQALGTGKKFLSDLFESSTLAYDQRDEWCHKLRSLTEKGKMDQMLQVQEMRDIKKTYDHEMKIYNFLAKKGVKRVNKFQEKREVEEKRAVEEEAKKKLSKHHKIFDDIADYTGEHNYRIIIDTFKKTECENFSMYILLNEFCAENVVLKRELDSLRRDVADRRDWNEMQVTKRETQLESLHNKLEEQKNITDKLRSKREEQDEMINRTMDKIREMFKMLDCSLEPFQNLLGDKQPTVNTLKMTLQLIAEKIREYIETVYYWEKVMKHKEPSGKSTSRLKKFTVRATMPVIFTPLPLNLLVPADPCPSCVESRWLSRVTDTAETPFSASESFNALLALSKDPAYVRSDRVHAIVDCRSSQSRRLLAKRYNN